MDRNQPAGLTTFGNFLLIGFVGLLAIMGMCSVANAQTVGWAPGVVYTANVYGDQETTDIIDFNGVVQTTAITSSEVQPALESHVLAGWTQFKMGPFIGAQLGDNLIDSVGAGVVFSFFDSNFNLGLGYWVKPKGNVRRADFIPGEPAPAGYDSVQYVEKAITSFAIMATIPLP